MSTIVQSLRTFLLANAAIASALGDRIGPAPMNEGAALPYATITRVSTVRAYNHDGQDRLVKTRVQIDAWATTVIAAEAIAELIRMRISGYAGEIATDVRASAIFSEGDTTILEPSPDQDERRCYGVSQDYVIQHHEASPTFSA